MLKLFECFGSLLFLLSVVCGRAGEPEVNLLLNVKSEDVNYFMVILCLVKQSLVGTVSQARLLTISAKSGTYCSLFWLRTHSGEDRLTYIYTQ